MPSRVHYNVWFYNCVGSVGNRQRPGGDGVSALLPADVRRLHRPLPRLHRPESVPPDRARLRSTSGVRRSDGHHLGHRPGRRQPIHRRLQTVSGSTFRNAVSICAMNVWRRETICFSLCQINNSTICKHNAVTNTSSVNEDRSAGQ